jgi:EAL domain-containing protein (putative c-di-GMP-specific phosphodiesterase class I)
VQHIRNILSRDSVAKGTLVLEVTESLVMENPEQAVEILGWLKKFGASLSLDDFGTGYSSLSYVHRFPVDTIKVDKSFLRDGDDDASRSVILKSIVTMAHELGKKVIAEGVETAADADYLRSIGCEYAQGFYYGEPMTEKEVKSLLGALYKAEKKEAKRNNGRKAQEPKAEPTAESKPAPKRAPQGAPGGPAKPVSGVT